MLKQSDEIMIRFRTNRISLSRACQKNSGRKAAGRLLADIFLLLSEVIIHAAAHQSKPGAV
jgi:hypothetical protein